MNFLERTNPSFIKEHKWRKKKKWKSLCVELHISVIDIIWNPEGIYFNKGLKWSQTYSGYTQNSFNFESTERDLYFAGSFLLAWI